MYQPGLHIIASIVTSQTVLLQDIEGIKRQIDALITEHELTKLGEVYHQFEGAGYTAVVCLSESHLSIHSWPEYDRVNLDIYLSNFLRNNDGTVERIFKAIAAYFGGTVTDVKKINR